MRRAKWTALPAGCVVAVVLAVAAAGGSGTMAAQAPPFGPQLLRDGPALDVSAARQTELARRVTLRQRFVTPDIAAMRAEADMPAPTLALNLFPDTTLHAVLDHVDRYPNGQVWMGHVEGVEFSTVSLSTVDGVLQGSVSMPGAIYAIRPVEGGLHLAAQLDSGKFPAEGAAGPAAADTTVADTLATAEIPLVPVATPVPASTSTSEAATTGARVADTGAMVGVMVLYTAAARTSAGGQAGIDARINLAISQTNAAFAASPTSLRVNLVHSGLLSTLADNNDLAATLRTVSNWNGSTPMSSAVGDAIATLRDTYRADQVTVLTAPAASPGCADAWPLEIAGWANWTRAQYAFSVVVEDCVSPNLSFQWALGRNFGAKGDWYTDNSTLPMPYAHGYVNLPSRFRTIMAEDRLCEGHGFSCTRLPLYSNGVAPYGVPLSYPNAADNRLAFDVLATFIVNFRGLPSVTVHPENATVASGGSTSFDAYAIGGPPPTVQWQRRNPSAIPATWLDLLCGAGLSGCTTNTLTLTGVAPSADGYEYRAKYTNSLGTAFSDVAVLNVTVPAPPVVTRQPLSLTVEAGIVAEFRAAATGTPTPTVQWQSRMPGALRTWADIRDATGKVLEYATGKTDDGREFRAVFSNSEGTATSNTATLGVGWAPDITTQPIDAVVAPGATATFTAAVDGNPTPTAQWQVSTNGGASYDNLANAAPYSGVTSNTLAITGVSAGLNGYLYRIRYTNHYAEALSDGVLLTVTAAPAVTAQPSDATTTAGGNATFTAAASGSPAPTVLWQVSTNGGSSYGDLTDAAPYSGVTTGTLTITGATAGLNGYRYRAAFTNVIGTAPSNGALLTVTFAPAITVQPGDTTVTSGANATFTAAASGSPVPTVHWEVSTDGGSVFGDIPEAAPYSGTTTGTLTLTGAGQAYAGFRYRAVFTNALGTATSNAAILSVNVPPQISANPANASVAVGGTTSFTAAATGTPAPTVQWQVSTNGGTSFSPLTNAAPYSGVTTGTLTITGATAGMNLYRYRAVFTNVAGTTTSDAAALTITGAPTITAQPASVTVGAGTNASFTAAATGTPTPTVQWEVSTNGGTSYGPLTNAAPYSGVTTGTLTITGATLGLNGYRYRAVFTNAVGATPSNAAVLTVTADVAPSVTSHPPNRGIAFGQSTTFTAAASGTPTPTVQWQVSANGGVVWTNLTNTAPYSGVTTGTLTITAATVSMTTYRYRAVFTNSAGAAYSLSGILIVYGNPSVSPAALRMAVTKNGAAGAIVAATPTQYLTVSWAGSGTGWSAQTSALWLALGNASGGGAGQFSVTISDAANHIGAATSLATSIVLTPALAGLSPVTIPVTLTVDQTGGAATVPPFGLVDTPAQNATGIQGAIGVTGWALDDVGVAHVRVYRNCQTFEPPVNCATVAGRAGMVYIGDATMTSGTRPDVEGAFPTSPQSYRGGWGYLFLTNMAPHVPNGLMFGGQGPLTLHVLATDVEGKQRWLGRTQTDTTPTTLTMANDSIAKPFGAIDTPGQGELKSGSFPNFGWALSPDSNTVVDASDILVPTAGASIQVWVDGVARGNPEAFNLCRGTTPMPTFCDDDIASIFGNTTPQPTYTTRTGNPTRFRNLDAGRGAIGYRHIDTTTLSNGLHTIEWSVYDSASRGEGIGSRYFTVLNAGGRAADESFAGAGSSEPRGDESLVGAGFSQPQGDVRLPSTSLGASPSTGLGASKPDATQAQPDLADRVSALRDAPAMSRGDAAPVEALPVAPATVSARTGFDLEAPLVDLAADDLGAYAVRAPALGRLELVVGPVDAGYLVANGTLRDLPIGSHLDAASGTFTWTPGVGYHGTYRLVFVGPGGRIPVAVTVRPIEAAAPGVAEIRMHLDTPQTGAAVGTSFVVAGWALDPQADIGAGIGRVHVWAQRTDAPGTPPVFLGHATLGRARPDVAQAHGAARAHAGFSLAAGPLAPGTYDVTAYVWNRRTARWEDARTAGGIVVK